MTAIKFESAQCIVTGGVNGIGHCIAEKFIAAGAGVYIIDDVGKGGILSEAATTISITFSGWADRALLSVSVHEGCFRPRAVVVNISSTRALMSQSDTESYTATDERQHPAGRIGVHRDIADMVLFLCGDQAGFITGQNIVIDGEMTKNMIIIMIMAGTLRPGENGGFSQLMSGNRHCFDNGKYRESFVIPYDTERRDLRCFSKKTGNVSDATGL